MGLHATSKCSITRHRSAKVKWHLSPLLMRVFQPFRLDDINQCLWRGDTRVSLMPKPFAVLRYLVEHAGRLVTQDELLTAIWPDTYVQPEVLRRYILEIRRVLGDGARARSSSKHFQSGATSSSGTSSPTKRSRTGRSDPRAGETGRAAVGTGGTRSAISTTRSRPPADRVCRRRAGDRKDQPR